MNSVIIISQLMHIVILFPCGSLWLWLAANLVFIHEGNEFSLSIVATNNGPAFVTCVIRWLNAVMLEVPVKSIGTYSYIALRTMYMYMSSFIEVNTD